LRICPEKTRSLSLQPDLLSNSLRQSKKGKLRSRKAESFEVVGQYPLREHLPFQLALHFIEKK
jgi:hypothetical protein